MPVNMMAGMKRFFGFYFRVLIVESSCSVMVGFGISERVPARVSAGGTGVRCRNDVPRHVSTSSGLNDIEI